MRIEPDTVAGSGTADAFATIRGAILAAADRLTAVSTWLHANPEISFQEYKAHDKLTAFLEAEGFAVERRYTGLETAWKASFTRGSGGPTFGLNSEYDALPGVGHACGHNLICVAGIAALIGMRAAMIAHDIAGTVVLLGTPAEEAGDGKVRLLERGAYNGIDACMMAHPAGESGKGVDGLVRPCLAVRSIGVEFFGKPAHAANAPYQGVNALDAANIAYMSISSMRQQLRAGEMVHGIITHGGDAPNVIPKYTAMEYYCRCGDADRLDKLIAKIVPSFHAAALATGCEVKLDISGLCADLRHAAPLADEYASVMAAEFGQHIDVDLTEAGRRMGSTDFGNVTYAMPACHPHFVITDLPPKVHTAEFAAIAATPPAHEQTYRVASGMAAVGVRFLTDEAFAARTKKAWRESMDEVGSLVDVAKWGANLVHLQ
ncbi:hypothetical protein VHUM_04051 [Vanrija humicola]|uniref:Peptidase M20 domain-containing protein 2 n=1 Tax=Vanrija humicola TaxID=5417 RepID=A0A7D8Z0A3_VANHU|nr:hypothetical protein VHUM_04051 [Vanrija humicola]